jgi:hypothetical protein
MLVSTESDANVMFIAMGAETTAQSRLSSSTGVVTDMHSSTLALQDDEAGSTSLGSGVAQPLANEDRLDIVRIGPPAQGALGNGSYKKVCGFSTFVHTMWKGTKLHREFTSDVHSSKKIVCNILSPHYK